MIDKAMYQQWINGQDAYDSWESSKEDDILEQYVLSIEDDYDETDLKKQIWLDHLTFKDVPEDFKDKMFEEWEENGGDEPNDI